MAITKSKTEIIPDKAAIQIREYTTGGTGTYETVGYVDGQSEIAIEPFTTEIEDGEHQLGVDCKSTFNAIQFADTTRSTLEAYVTKKVDVKFLGVNKTITLKKHDFVLGMNAKLDMKNPLKFTCSCRAWHKTVGDAITIGAAE